MPIQLKKQNASLITKYLLVSEEYLWIYEESTMCILLVGKIVQEPFFFFVVL